MTVSENTTNLEATPKKKRGRPSKAELAERERLMAEAQETQETAPEEIATFSGETNEEVVEAAPKRKRIRRTKAEIIAAAEAAAVALAENNQKKAEAEAELVPEAAFAVGSNDEAEDDDEPTMGLIERLQSKVQSQNAAKDEALAAAIAEGKDFIVLQDLPVEDNGVIPYFDMFDNPNTQENHFVS